MDVSVTHTLSVRETEKSTNFFSFFPVDASGVRVMPNQRPLIIAIGVIGAFAFVVWGIPRALDWLLDDLFSASFAVIRTESSPDRRFKAVVVESDGGATTGLGYLIYIEPIDSGSQEHLVANFEDAIQVDGTPGVGLKWTSPSMLELDYSSAKHVYGIPKEIEVGGTTFTVKSR